MLKPFHQSAVKSLLIVAIGLLVISVGYLLFSKKTDEQPASSQVTGDTSSASVASDTPTLASTPTTSQVGQAGSYIDYSPDVIAKTAGTKLLFFYAPWCPQCRALEASIQKGPIPSGVTIVKVDYDTNQALRQKYGVTIQTTLVKVTDAGELIKMYVAYDEPTLQAVGQNLLP